MLQGVSRIHLRCPGVIPDAPRSIFSMFMKIDFSMNFPEFAWRRVLRTPPLLLGGVPQVFPELHQSKNGAKHSPPGHQGAPNCPQGGPPLDTPETPLTHHKFPGTSPIQEFSTSIIIMVRSTLLQVTRGRQIAQRGILQSILLRPLCQPITFPELHNSKYPKFKPQ